MIVPKINTPQQVTQQTITPPKTYTYQTVMDGTVQLSLPNIGIMLVRPNATYNLSKYFVCRPQINATAFGTSNIDFPLPGAKVSFSIVPDTYKGYILSTNSIGTQQKSYTTHNYLHGYSWDKPLQDLQFQQTLIQEIDKQTHGTQRAAPCGALEDIHAGDTYIGDKNAGGLFIGKAIITVKGSDLAYTQYSAISDKITTVACTIETDTLSTLHQFSNNIDKYLKAGSEKQGLGIYNTANAYPVYTKGYTVTADTHIASPIYRYQKFNGGAVSGECISIHSYIEPKTQVVSTQANLYSGTIHKASINNLKSIKTPTVIGLKHSPQSDPKEINKKKEQLKKTYESLYIQETNNATEKALLMQLAYANSDTGMLLSSLWDIDTVLKMVDEGIVPQADSVFPGVSRGEPAQIGQQLPPPQKAEIQSTFDKSKTIVMNNTSFITQQSDGSIIIKDGYGSSIIMTRGNIYISSALDTFIRPGRDLVGLIPRRAEITSNQSIVLAAKKDISVAAQHNTKISSAVSGGIGYTVIQNRSGKDAINSGMVIRSNADMSITASKDMRIALNDKTVKNAGDKATLGTGSIIIEGNQLALKSNSIMNICAKDGFGLYAYNGSTGSGINIGVNYIDIVGPSLNFDTGAIDIGKSKTTHTVKLMGEQKSFTLNSGSGTLGVHLNGQLYCRDIFSAGSVIVSSQVIGNEYFVLSTKKSEIYSLPKSSIDGVRKTLKTIGTYTYKAGGPVNISIVQNWYNDNYICSKQLMFTSTAALNLPALYKMPTMTWQMNPIEPSYTVFTPVKIKETGNDTYTYTYPGKDAWEAGMMATVNESYMIDYTEKPLLQSYTTNTKKGN